MTSGKFVIDKYNISLTDFQVDHIVILFIIIQDMVKEVGSGTGRQAESGTRCHVCPTIRIRKKRQYQSKSSILCISLADSLFCAIWNNSFDIE